MILSLDCEVGGLDLFHGARPFLVTTFSEENKCLYWEVLVDPETRVPQWSKKQLIEILELIDSADYLIGQNIKFDVEALTLLFRDYNLSLEWPWEKTYDTLIAGHLLASNQKHDLTSMCIDYLDEDISCYEEKMKKEVQKVRRKCKKEFPTWSKADKDNPKTPSVKTSSNKKSVSKDSAWGHDMWMLAAYANAKGLEEDHEYWTFCSDYANMDSLATYYLWKEQEKCIHSRKLWKIFLERMKLVPIAKELEMPIYQNEIRGITINGGRTEQMIDAYTAESESLKKNCINIARKLRYDLQMPKTGCNDSLREFCFNRLGLKPLPKHKRGKTGNPSLDKKTLEEYEIILEGNQLSFIKSLRKKRRLDTAVTYLKGYKRFWQPMAQWGNIVGGDGASLSNHQGYFVLHGSANPTGSDTLRWSFSNPNAANISRQQDFNLRFAFGPAPGREWYSMDGQNLELRIPSYESGEEDAIWVFEHPNDPPYYGSYHLLVFDALHPEKFKEYGKRVKNDDIFGPTWYQWTKNGNFAIIYGCQEATGDAAYHQVGAYKKIRHRFPKIAALSDKQIKNANRYGYVQTVPDRTVDAAIGYPIMCSRSENGYILPTVPLNYHIQSTAMQWTNSAMINCRPKIQEWQSEGFDIFGVLQVHDELVFDAVAVNEDNLWRIADLKYQMERAGDRIGVPTPVSVERHVSNWAEGDDITKQLELVLSA